MSKFKVGDKVITITKAPFSYSYEIGSLAVVRDIEDFSIRMQDGAPQFCQEHNVELEQVFYSPLYEALK